MRLIITGHITIDKVEGNLSRYSSMGGPPVYCGLAAKSFGLDVSCITKVGGDFPDEYATWLARNQIDLAKDSKSSASRTTTFRIITSGERREVYLLARCKDLEATQLVGVEADALILNSVAGEAGKDFSRAALDAAPVKYLDPQGFLRSFTPEGKAVLESKLDAGMLPKIDFLKVDADEARIITGKGDRKSIVEALVNLGVKWVILTSHSEQLLLFSRDGTYTIPVLRKEPRDTTGAGDIFGGVFVASILKEPDPVWAACVASSAAGLSVAGMGISKVPPYGAVVEEAQKTHSKTRREG